MPIKKLATKFLSLLDSVVTILFSVFYLIGTSKYTGLPDIANMIVGWTLLFIGTGGFFLELLDDFIRKPFAKWVQKLEKILNLSDNVSIFINGISFGIRTFWWVGVVICFYSLLSATFEVLNWKK